MKTYTGKVKPIHGDVLVHNMQKSSGGLIILGDDGKDRGIHSRWGQVYAKGSENTDEYSVGDWILIDHGRWTRGIDIENDNGEVSTVRKVDTDCILVWSKELPSDVLIAETIEVPSINEAYRLENN